MSVTPQTNTTLQHIADELQRFASFIVCGHVGPDGDCLGSCAALTLALQSQGKTVHLLNASTDPIDDGLACIPGIDRMVAAEDFAGQYDAFIALDVPTSNRMGPAAAALHEAAPFTVTIDHHAVPERMSDLSYTDPDAASTSMLIWDLVECMGVDRTADIATAVYVGLMTDTGRFQYQNTDTRAFRTAYETVMAGVDPAALSREVYQNRRLASVELEGRAISRMRMGSDGGFVLSWLSRADFEETGAVKSDAEPLIDTLRSLRGVRVACMLRDQGDGSIRGSFRAKDGTDVARLARLYDGGGHKAAAGFTLFCSLEDAVDQVYSLLSTELSAEVDA